MNKPLRRVATAALALIVILMINVNYIQGSQADKLRADPLNNRQFGQQFTHDRGPIMAGNVTLAESKKISKDSKKYERIYHDGNVFAPITGYMSLYTATGLEGADNSLLNGTDKRLTIHNWFDTLIGKKPAGATVQTTINPKAQRAAYSSIKGTTQNRGAAVAIDVKTGAILAMASYPSFDPNDIAVQDADKAEKNFTRLQHKDGKPLLDKATGETFQPGSSFKIVDSSAAFESAGMNENSPADASQLTLPESGTVLHNSDGDEAACSGSPPLIDSFAASCNSTFGRLALHLGQSTLGDQAAKYGFNKHVEIAPGMKSAASAYPTKKIGGDQLARSGIGQDVVTATPLQMAMVAQTVANGGNEMKPYLVKRVTAPDQSELETADPQQLGQPISADSARQIQDMMRAVVERGTAHSVLGGHDIAGKTGTAETGGRYNENWFVGFAPQHDPKVAFAVITEGPQGTFGADYSGPIALKIVQAVLGR